MNRKIILKWKIRKIVRAIKKYDSETQNESILQIKNVLHNVCVSDDQRNKYIDLVYRSFKEKGLV